MLLTNFSLKTNNQKSTSAHILLFLVEVPLTNLNAFAVFYIYNTWH